MSSSQQENISNFLTITNCEDEGTAQFFLESSGWDLSQAVETYFGSQQEGGGDLLNSQGAQGAAQQQPAVQIPRPNVREDAGTNQSSRGTRGGAGGPVRGLQDIGRDDDEEEDEDDDMGNEYYAGGEKSGMVIKAPGKKADEEVDTLFNKAREMGAREGTAEDREQPKQRNFTGTARTLDGRQVEARQDKSQRRRRKVTFYRNGVFVIDDGEPRSVMDPANAPFMQAIMRGECPAELESEDRQPVEVDLMKKDEDYIEPEKPKVIAFTGQGNRLRDEAPQASSSNTQQSQQVSGQWEGVNENEPVTSIQLRLADGSRMVARFNHTHTIADIRRFIRASRPDIADNYRLMTTFPRKELTDNEKSIAEEGLINAVITQQAS
eukprot:TRINITY_DN10839_c0_g3_i2.p1 TRINITY_DN10839_c0_g3~~TRINITY_DN10839_c0_g3_i2.p1  ORF type:complete len:411 (-),score=57.86 TRINITY_DN10839_c0_g3_i2:291-1427(-)